MGLFNNFSKKVQESSSSRGEDYGLDEILAILDMANNDVPKEKIVELTGRTKDSLNYKVFERQTTIKGKTQCRSVLKFMYKDHKEKGSEWVDEETFLKRLFEAHGETYGGPEDVEARIKQYCDGRGINLEPEQGSTPAA